MIPATALALVLLYGSTTPLVATLSGSHVCNRQELYNKTIQVVEERPFKVRKNTWCLKVPPRCTEDRHEMREVVVNQVVEEMRNVSECCTGFVPVPIGAQMTCLSSCLNKSRCLHGFCGDYDQCLCYSGYHGDFCQKTCPMGRWGPNCSNPCHCTTCHHQTGLCYDTNATWRLTSTSTSTTSTSTFSPLTLDPPTSSLSTSSDWDNHLPVEDTDSKEESLITNQWQITTNNVESENESNNEGSVTSDSVDILNSLVFKSEETLKNDTIKTSSSRPVVSLALPGLNYDGDDEDNEVDHSPPSASAPTQLVQRQPRELLAGLSVALAVALAIIIVAILILAITAKRFRTRNFPNDVQTNLNPKKNMASIVRKSVGGLPVETTATATAVAITCKAAVATFDLPLPVRDLYFTPVLTPPFEENTQFELAQLSLPPPHLLAARHSLPARNRASTESHYDVPPSARASLPASPDRSAFEPIYDEIPGWRFANSQRPSTLPQAAAISTNNNNISVEEEPPPLPSANGQRLTSFGAV